MSGFADAKADRGALKSQLTKNIDQGEKLTGFWFTVKIDGYPNFETRVRTSQYPAMGYELCEDYCQGGLKSTQQGALQNSQEIVVTCVENLKGESFAAIKDIILNKKSVKISFEVNAESLGGKKVPNTDCVMHHCKLTTDAVDFSTEDVNVLVKPSLNITTDWIDHGGVD